jgi:hypothetical protein
MTSVMALTVIAALARGPRPARSALRRVTSIAAITAFAAALISLPATTVAVATGYRADQRVEGLACLTDWIGSREITGAGSFWVTRPLNLYGGKPVDLLQVNFDFSAQPWMTDIAWFEHKHVSYFLVSDEAPWRSMAEDHLGAPASVASCPGFQIWDYAGTPGETRLTLDIATSTAEYLRERTP